LKKPNPSEKTIAEFVTSKKWDAVRNIGEKEPCVQP